MSAAIVSAVSGETASIADQRRLGFETRRPSGRGIFITEQEIRDANASTLGTLLRHRPGIHFTCRPAFIVDGASADYSTDLDTSTAGLIGIEIYRTAVETPLPFLNGMNTCGTIVIWTEA